MRRRSFVAWITAIVIVIALQTTAHLAIVLGTDRIGTFVDLDRSNGLPDLVSTVVLALAVAGAATISGRENGARRLVAGLSAGLLATLTLADLLHDGAHPSRNTGPLVIALVVGTVILLAFISVEMGLRARVTLAVGVSTLAASFLVGGLDRLDPWFERERGDAVAELQIVTKEGFELLGWSLVALALWDTALGLRGTRAADVATRGEMRPQRESAGHSSGRDPRALAESVSD